MAWNKDQYSAYGDYNDAQFYGANGATAYDMFDDSAQGQANDPYAGQWEAQGSGYGYYDPNSFQQPSPQPPTAQSRGPQGKVG